MKDINEIIKKNELNLSNWNINNVTDISYLFYNCSSLSSLPDISKWETYNVKRMRNLFNNCISLSSLPDISKWNITKTEEISELLSNCSSLISLPEFSKWNTKGIKYEYNKKNIFSNCFSLLNN